MNTTVIELKGLDESAEYEFFCCDCGKAYTISGAELSENGFEIRLDEKYSSRLIKYRRI